MRNRAVLIAIVATVVVFSLGGLTSIAYLARVSSSDVAELRVPGMDNQSVEDPTEIGLVQWIQSPDSPAPSAISETWSCFRGDNLDAIRSDCRPLARSWPEGGPPELWAVDLGEGYAGAAIRNGCVYVVDYDQENKADAVRCLSLDDGREIWRYTYEVDISRYHGISRTVPAVDGQFCFSIGPYCHVSALDAITGEPIWGAKDEDAEPGDITAPVNMVQTYGTEIPEWYAGQCPLLDDDKLILAPSGPEKLLVAIDPATGEEIWATPNDQLQWKMTHTSVLPMDLDGRWTYVYAGTGGVAGIAADTGEILWSTDAWQVRIATCPSPLVLPGNRLFLCGGYNSGAMLIRLEPGAGGKYNAIVERTMKPREFSSTQQTPVLYEGHIYGVRQADKEFVCLDLDGNEVWSSGRDARFGDGPYMIADGLIFILDDVGVLTMAEATSDGYRQLGRCSPFGDEGHDAWAPMAMVDGRLILRDLVRMKCLDVAASR